MADLSITAASVIAGAGARRSSGDAGETVTAGKVVYKSTTSDEWMLADSNGSTEAKSPGGIALNGAADGQPLAVHTEGPLTIGATLTPGVAYYLSDTPGGICPVADVGSGENAVIIGIATSTTVLDVNIQASGVAL